MEKLFNRIYWANNTVPALNQTNLNSMSKAIDDIDDRVIELGGAVLETIPELAEYLSEADTLVDSLENIAQRPAYIGQNGHWYVFDTTTEDFVDSGIDATPSITIADVTALEPNQTPYVTNTGTASDPIFHLFIPKGQKGDPGSAGAWSSITNKPFSTVGYGLRVVNDALTAVIQSVSLLDSGGQSSDPAYQTLYVNGGEVEIIDGTYYLHEEGVSLSSSQSTTVTVHGGSETIVGAIISEIYFSNPDVVYTSADTVSGNNVEIVFPPQTISGTFDIRVYLRDVRF